MLIVTNNFSDHDNYELDDNNDNADDIETQSDHLETTQKLSDISGQHTPPYISEENDELTEGDDEFEKSEMMENTSDGILYTQHYTLYN